MTSCSHCGCPLPVVPPERVVAYLEERGWVEQHSLRTECWRYFTRDGEDVDTAMLGRAADYPRRFLELLADLRRIEGRSMAEIAAEMNSPGFPES